VVPARGKRRVGRVVVVSDCICGLWRLRAYSLLTENSALAKVALPHPFFSARNSVHGRDRQSTPVGSAATPAGVLLGISPDGHCPLGGRQPRRKRSPPVGKLRRATGSPLRSAGASCPHHRRRSASPTDLPSQLLQLRDLLLATDEARQLIGEVVLRSCRTPRSCRWTIERGSLTLPGTREPTFLAGRRRTLSRTCIGSGPIA
jgi:hypothetical protein